MATLEYSPHQHSSRAASSFTQSRPGGGSGPSVGMVAIPPYSTGVSKPIDPTPQINVTPSSIPPPTLPPHSSTACRETQARPPSAPGGQSPRRYPPQEARVQAGRRPVGVVVRQSWTAKDPRGDPIVPIGPHTPPPGYTGVEHWSSNHQEVDTTSAHTHTGGCININGVGTGNSTTPGDYSQTGGHVIYPNHVVIPTGESSVDTGVGRVTRVSSAPARRGCRRDVSGPSGRTAHHPGGATCSPQVTGQVGGSSVQGSHCTQVRYERYSNNNTNKGHHNTGGDNSSGQYHKSVTNPPVLSAPPGSAGQVFSPPEVPQTTGSSSVSNNLSTRVQNGNPSYTGLSVSGARVQESNSAGVTPTGVAAQEEGEEQEKMMRYEREVSREFVAGGAGIRPPDDFLQRYGLFRSNTGTDLRGAGGNHRGVHNPNTRPGGPNQAGGTKVRGGSAGNAVSANNYWWMHTRDSVNPFNGTSGGGSISTTRPEGGYREIHVTLPSTSGGSPREDGVSKGGPPPSAGQHKGRQSPSKQRPLGTTRANEYDYVGPGGKPNRPGTSSNKGHSGGLASSSGAGRSFGTGAAPSTPNHHSRRDAETVVAPVDGSYHQQGQHGPATTATRRMPHESCIRTSSAILNGDPMADRQQGLILPTQTGTNNDKVHFQVVVQKGKSQKRFQISTRLEDIRRARETGHRATGAANSKSYRHLVTDPGGTTSGSGLAQTNGYNSYSRGSPSTPGGGRSQGSSTSNGHSHRVLQELAARYANFGEQEPSERTRKGSASSSNSSNGGPQMPSGETQAHSSWGKHGGVIRYDNISGLETIANCLREEDCRTFSGTGSGGVSPITSILKRKSRSPQDTLVTEKPEAGWQQAIEGSNLTWSDYFCVTIGGESGFGHMSPSYHQNYPHHQQQQQYGYVAVGGSHSRGSPRGVQQTRAEHRAVTVRPARQLTITPSVRGMTLVDTHKHGMDRGMDREEQDRKTKFKRSVRFSTSNKVHEYNPDSDTGPE